jgi:hypothetical protein
MPDLGRHTDWPWLFSWVPRSWTTFKGSPPKQLFGNVPNGEHLDIPPPGHWTITWPPYFAFQTKSGWLFRIGIRWDYNSGTYEFPSFKIGHYII